MVGVGGDHQCCLKGTQHNLLTEMCVTEEAADDLSWLFCVVPPLCSCHPPHPLSSSYATAFLTFPHCPHESSHPSSSSHPHQLMPFLSHTHTSTRHTHAKSLSPLSCSPSPSTPPLPSLRPSLNWESGRAVEIALTRALPGCAIHLLFYYAAPGLPGRCRSICHRPRSLITGICHRLASLLMLSSPP